MNTTPMKLFQSKASPKDLIKSMPPQNSLLYNPKTSYVFSKQNKDDDSKQSRGAYQTFSRVNDSESEMNLFKQDLERQYHERITQIQQMTQFRLESLWDSVQSTLKSVLEDELIETMKQDPTSQEFIWHRIVELFDELFNGEREKIVEKLSEQYGLLKAEGNQQQRIIQQLEQKLQDVEGQFQAQGSNYYKEIEQSRNGSEVLLQERLQNLKDVNQELQLKLQQSQQQCLFIQQANDQFKEGITDLSQQILHKEQQQSFQHIRFGESLVLIKSKLDQRIQEFEESYQKRHIIYKTKIEDLKYLITRMKQKQNGYKFNLQTKFQQRKNEMELQYEANFKKLTKDIEKLTSKNTKLRESKENYDIKVHQLEDAITEQNKIIQQRNFEFQQLSQERQFALSKIEEMANEKENEQLNSSKRKDREANKLIVTLQEREAQYAILLQKNRELEVFYNDQLSQMKDKLKSTVDENDLHIKEVHRQLIDQKEIELQKLQKVQQKLQEKLYEEKGIHLFILSESTTSQIHHLRRQLDERDVMYEQMKEKILITEIQYTNQLEITQKEIKQLKQNIQQVEKEFQNKKQSEYQLIQDNQQFKNQIEEDESQIYEFKNLIHQQQSIIDQQKDDYRSKISQELEEVIQASNNYQSEIQELQRYCQDMDEQNQALQQQMYNSKNSALEAKEQKEKIVKKCKDKVKRILFILNEQKAQCVFELTKIKREVQSLRQFTIGCLQSEKSQLKLILSAFEAQFKGMVSQIQLNFKNQQMILKNQYADKYETINASIKDQNKLQINEIQSYSDNKIRQLTGQNREYQQEIQEQMNIIERKEQIVQQFQEEFQNLTNDNQQLEELLKDKQNEILGSLYEVDISNQAIQKLENQINSLDKDKQQYKEQVQTLMKQIQTLKEGKDASLQSMQNKQDNQNNKIKEENEEEKNKIQDELSSIKRQYQDKTRLSESLQIRLIEAEKMILELEQSLDDLHLNTQKRKPLYENELKNKETQLEKLNQINRMQQDEISKTDKENSKLKQMIQRMSESFEERTVETSKENLELIKIQNHLQDEIKGLYKVLTHTSVNDKDKEREKDKELFRQKDKEQYRDKGKEKENFHQKLNESKDLESKLKQLKELNSILDEKQKKKYPSSNNLRLSPSTRSGYKYNPRSTTQQSPKD